ncbi:MAG: hypothetical protein II363_02745 [Clostridia bacterium]|nr:hypothetical protein [Clostridia bacterium]
MKKRTKNTLKLSLKVWGRLLMSGIMCAVLSLSMSVLGNGLLAKDVGYRIIQVTQIGENSEATILKEHRYTQNEKPVEGMELPEGQYFQAISEMTPAVKTLMDVLTQLGMLFLLGVFPYNLLWEVGNKDENKVRYRNRRPEPWRGLKIGLLSMIPTALLYVALWLSKGGVLPAGYLAVYRVLNTPYLPYINWFIPVGVSISEIAFWRLFAVAGLVVFVPAVCVIGYRLGFCQFSIKEHLTYQSPEKEEQGEV